MDLKIYRDTIHTMGVLNDVAMEIPIETEILIPDYLPAVFKIVKTVVHRVILQKQLQTGHLLAEGYFRVEVFYQGEDQNLCTVEQKVAFSKQQDVKGLEDVQVCMIGMSGEVQYINCRAVSQRRLDLHGAYNMQVRIFGGMEQELITALSEEGIQQKPVAVPLVQLYASREKQFTLEESFHFEQPPEQILHMRTFYRAQEARIAAGKAIVKGEARAEILYRATEAKQLQSQEVVLPFNLVVELEQAADDFECQAVFEPIGCAVFEEGTGEGTTKLSCTGLMTVRAVRAAEFIGVGDCFSTLYQTETVYNEIVTDALMETVSNDVSVLIEGTLPDDALEVIQCLVECSTPDLLPEGERTVIRGKATAHLFCKNPLGEIDCYDKTGEYILPKRFEFKPEELAAGLTAACQNVQIMQKGNAAVVETVLRVQGFLCCKHRSQLVESVACKQPLEKENEVALRVYYAAEGEAVFDIAKRYHASPAVIASLAGMEGDVLKNDMQLLIPQVQ